MKIAIEKESPFIYEMIDGNPIYYKGYKEYLAGTRQLDDIIGSSKLQSLIIAELIFLLRTYLGDDYLIFTNELGLQFSKNSWRAADIAVIRRDKITNIDNKYLAIPPDLVIEIDTKAELSEIQNPLGYYHEKTDEIIQFGVERVVWIFTDTQKVMIAEKNNTWQISDWDDKIELTKGLDINLKELLDKRLP